jgi:hypothetical protein
VVCGALLSVCCVVLCGCGVRHKVGNSLSVTHAWKGKGRKGREEREGWTVVYIGADTVQSCPLCAVYRTVLCTVSSRTVMREKSEER